MLLLLPPLTLANTHDRVHRPILRRNLMRQQIQLVGLNDMSERARQTKNCKSNR